MCLIFYASYQIIFNGEIHNALFNLEGFWRQYSRDCNCQHHSLSQAKMQNDTTFLRPDIPPSSGWTGKQPLETVCLAPGGGPSKWVLRLPIQPEDRANQVSGTVVFFFETMDKAQNLNRILETDWQIFWLDTDTQYLPTVANRSLPMQ